MFEEFPEYQKQAFLLKKALASNDLAQSYLFYGSNTEGILNFTKQFAKVILCLKDKQNGCSCSSCQTFRNKEINHPDLIGLNFEWSRQTKQSQGVKTLREILHQLKLSPFWGKTKIAILRYADHFNKESANTLLKILEEPNKSSYVILLAQNKENVLSTIVSRTFNIEFREHKNNSFSLKNYESGKWEKVFKFNVKEKFDLAEDLTKKEQNNEFLEWFEQFLRKKIEILITKNQKINKTKVFKLSKLLNKTFKAKQTILNTNANKRLILENLFLDIGV